MANPNMPHGDDRINGNGIKAGYVVYTRKSHSEHWERTRNEQWSKVDSWWDSLPSRPTQEQYDAVGDFLIDLGEKEEVKEKALISKVFGKECDAKTEVELINQFNIALKGRDQYKETLDRLTVAVNDNHKKWGPAKANMYADKFIDVFKTKLNYFIEKKLPSLFIECEKNNQNVGKAIENEVMRIYDESVEKGFKEMLKYTNTKGIEVDQYGTGTSESQQKIYRDLLELFNNNEIIREMVMPNLKGIVSKDTLKGLAGKITQNYVTGGVDSARFKSKKALKVETKINGRETSVGGFIHETVTSMQDSIPERVDLSNTGVNIKSNKSKIDTITAVTTVEINKKVILDYVTQMSEKLDKTSGSLIETHKVMMEYWNKYLSKLTDGFIVFKNAKMYSLNSISEYGGFKNGSSIPIGELRDLPRAKNLSDYIDINRFVIVIANTIDGAVLAKDYERIREWVYTYVFESITSLLFDDWENIGNEMSSTKANAIHALLLEDINVPFSVFLKGAGNALKKAIKEVKATDYINIVMRKSKNLYPAEDYETPNNYPLKDNGEPAVGRAWNIQRQDALDNYKITIKFYRNFNELVLENILANTNLTFL